MATSCQVHTVISALSTVQNAVDRRLVQNVRRGAMDCNVNICVAVYVHSVRVLHSVLSAFLADMDQHVS